MKYLIFVMILFISVTYAENQLDFDDLLNMSIEDLYNVKIESASKSARSIIDLPITAYIVTKEQILSSNYVTLTDVLKTLPSVKISSPGSGTDGETFLIRGFYGNYYTKILLNGMPIQPSITAGIAIDEQIYIRNAERIEIIYGPGSALYGADALTGIINIITEHENETLGNIQVKAGGKGYLNGNFFGTFVIDSEKEFKFDYYAKYQKRNDQNIVEGYWDVYNPEVYNDMDFDAVFDDIPQENWTFGTGITYNGWRFSYDHTYRKQHSSLGQRPDVTAYDDSEAFWGETVAEIGINKKFIFDDIVFKTSLSYLLYRIDNKSYFNTVYQDTIRFKNYKYGASDDIAFESSVVWNGIENWEFVGGINYDYTGAFPKTNDLTEPFDTDDYTPFSTELPPPDPVFGYFGYNPFTQYNAALFLQAMYSKDRLSFIAGTRYDYNSDYGSSVNPRIGIRYNLTKSFSARASYGKAFRAPSAYYMYNSIASERSGNTVNYFSIPNENLNPEKINSGELGFRYIVHENFSMDLIGFYSKLDGMFTIKNVLVDTLQYPNTYNPGVDKAGKFHNDGASYSWGGEYVVNYKNIFPSAKLGMFFALSYTKGKEELPGDEGEIDDLRQAPEWLSKLRVYSSPVKNLFLSLEVVYCGDWYSRKIRDVEDYEDPKYKNDGYFAADFSANYRLNSFTIGLTVKNLFDNKYGGMEAYGTSWDLNYNPQYRRSIYVDLVYNF